MSKISYIGLLAVVISAMIPTILQADSNTYQNVPAKAEYQVLANQISTKYAVKASTVKKIIGCESDWSIDAHNVTKKENSYGLVQINRMAHPDVTVSEAKDPGFAIDYLASNLANKKNLWINCSK